jgi:hypothetical protein
MAAQTLQELYKLEPTGKEAVQKSAGYAVFNNMGTNLFLLSTARGAGIAVNSSRNGKTLRLESTQRCPFFHSFLRSLENLMAITTPSCDSSMHY